MARPSTGHNRRPWSFSATGYLEALFKDGDESQRAQRGLQERGVPVDDMRLYLADEILSNETRFLADYDVSYLRHDSNEGVWERTFDAS